jgi:hypothetical protein
MNARSTSGYFDGDRDVLRRTSTFEHLSTEPSAETAWPVFSIKWLLGATSMSDNPRSSLKRSFKQDIRRSNTWAD